METKPRVLVAAQPPAWPVLDDMLREIVELVPVHTMRAALAELERDPAAIHLIICTLTFSDHQMLEFLLTVKGDARTAAIPFLVCRVVVGRLSEALVERMGAVARHCGAEFFNIPRFPADEAAKALQAMVVKCLREPER